LGADSATVITQQESMPTVLVSVMDAACAAGEGEEGYGVAEGL
jgi:hypothetical protein